MHVFLRYAVAESRSLCSVLMNMVRAEYGTWKHYSHTHKQTHKQLDYWLTLEWHGLILLHCYLEIKARQRWEENQKTRKTAMVLNTIGCLWHERTKDAFSLMHVNITRLWQLNIHKYMMVHLKWLNSLCDMDPMLIFSHLRSQIVLINSGWLTKPLQSIWPSGFLPLPVKSVYYYIRKYYTLPIMGLDTPT